MKRTVWYGRMEFGDFKKDNDTYPVALVHSIDLITLADSDEAEEYINKNNTEYLFPEIFKGEIMFSYSYLAERYVNR